MRFLYESTSTIRQLASDAHLLTSVVGHERIYERKMKTRTYLFMDLLAHVTQRQNRYVDT